MPTLGAGERHVIPAGKLVTGKANHYWEDTGIVGLHYQQALGVDVYAWDVWMIYQPGVLWKDDLPPKPVFWMHQLAHVKNAPRLDSKIFAAKTAGYLAEIEQNN